MYQNEPIKKVKKSACGLDLETVLARIEAALGPAQRQWYINLDNATKHYSAPRLFFKRLWGQYDGDISNTGSQKATGASPCEQPFYLLCAQSLSSTSLIA